MADKVFRRELSPVDFLERAGEAYADRIGAVDGEQRWTFRELRGAARKLASALRADGLRKGDRIAFLALNSAPLLIAHTGVPLAGGVLVAINTRLNADEVAYIVEHSGARAVFFSPELRGMRVFASARRGGRGEMGLMIPGVVTFDARSIAGSAGPLGGVGGLLTDCSRLALSSLISPVFSRPACAFSISSRVWTRRSV